MARFGPVHWEIGGAAATLRHCAAADADLYPGFQQAIARETTHTMQVDLSVTRVKPGNGQPVSGPSALAGVLHGHWDTRAAGAVARMHGQLRGRPIVVTFPAP